MNNHEALSAADALEVDKWQRHAAWHISAVTAQRGADLLREQHAEIGRAMP